ncbi:integrase [Bacillus sp. AFS073361]|uniref:tyrosine-type recombinase/integrase n=1 Tax=Bacillus sp. AFS073361 TaxID=2033511 RepID=UPI000BF7B376|nr:site-specific integrase [Bacillus sp. AFS073361]PFP30101.1 integrase [Bacillus sp. AFS073361]
MALQKRARRKPVRELANKKEYPNLTLDQALDFVISGKKAEGLRERTLTDYAKMWRYFTDWLKENYEDVETVDQLTKEMFRNYISYLRYDAKRYDGHKFIYAKQQGVGLKEATINIRVRTYRAIFNHLESEGLIEVNRMDNVKELRTDVDLTNCFTDEDVKNRKPRLIPFSAHVSKLLLQLIGENREHFKTDRLFLSSYGENLGWNQLNKRLKYYAKKAGIDGKKVTSHVYRHTWAKNMILNGCDPFTLQKMGGWQDIRTMRRYIQMDTTEMRRSHDDFSQMNKFRNKRV